MKKGIVFILLILIGIGVWAYVIPIRQANNEQKKIDEDNANQELIVANQKLVEEFDSNLTKSTIYNEELHQRSIDGWGFDGDFNLIDIVVKEMYSNFKNTNEGLSWVNLDEDLNIVYYPVTEEYLEAKIDTTKEHIYDGSQLKVAESVLGDMFSLNRDNAKDKLYFMELLYIALDNFNEVYDEEDYINNNNLELSCKNINHVATMYFDEEFSEDMPGVGQYLMVYTIDVTTENYEGTDKIVAPLPDRGKTEQLTLYLAGYDVTLGNGITIHHMDILK
jgi:hypothetical protein